MNEKISSLFDSEINNIEVDTLLAKKNKKVFFIFTQKWYTIV